MHGFMRWLPVVVLLAGPASAATINVPAGDVAGLVAPSLSARKVIPEETRNAFLGKAEPISADMSSLLSTL